MVQKIKRIPKAKIINLVEKNMDLRIREIGDKTTAALIENIMSSIINTTEIEEEREKEFKFYIREITNAKNIIRVFGVKKDEIIDVLEKVFNFDLGKCEIRKREIKELCFEDKLTYFGFYRRWLKAYKEDININSTSSNKLPEKKFYKNPQNSRSNDVMDDWKKKLNGYKFD